MKKKTIKSLIVFLIFNSTFLVSSNAQIVYHDVIPNATVTCSGNSCNQKYNIDLNNDSVIDFELTTIHSHFNGGGGYPPMTNSGVSILPKSSNAVATDSNFVSQLIAMQSIDSSSLWHYSTGPYFKRYFQIASNPQTITGLWSNSLTGYVGLKLVVGGQTYYGWLRMQINVNISSASMTIMDYAYNSVPNYQILAGQTSCPTPTVTLNPGGSLSICQGDNVTLTGNGTGSQYQWKKNGVNISGAIQQTYVAKKAGAYNVIVTNSCGSSQASNSATVTVGLPCKNLDASLSIASDALEHLSVYPNPATNSVTIKIPSTEAGEIQIINFFGCVVETHNYASLRDGELQIDVTKFPVGMYMVRWRSGENYKTKRLSVIK